MDDVPLVLYHGSDAAEIEQRWGGDDRPFALVGTSVADDVPSLLADGSVDCVVIAGGEDPLGIVERVHEAVPALPVVVLDGEGVTSAAALASGVTHYLADDGDRITLLESLGPVVEQYRVERRERTMLDSLLSNIPVSVYFKDLESRFVRVSDAMLTMLGTPYIENPEGKRFHTPDDVVGASEYDLFPSGPAEQAVADDRTVVETEESIDNKIEHVYGSVLDGTYVATSKAPWYDGQGDVVGLIGVTVDVSERKQYEHRLERQNERLERFARVLSHDLRSPLEVARGRLDLAREADEPGEHHDAIERSLDRMDALVDDVLTIARQGEAVDDPEPVSIREVAHGAWEVVDAPDATLAVDTDVTIEADPSRLRRLFENLFRNAMEHAGRTDPTVSVRDIHGDHGFVVSDDGEGIPEDEREDVFDAGFTTGEDGAGLGLDIVQSIADAHGWHVTVQESDEGGAAFKFEVPR